MTPWRPPWSTMNELFGAGIATSLVLFAVSCRVLSFRRHRHDLPAVRRHDHLLGGHFHLQRPHLLADALGLCSRVKAEPPSGHHAIAGTTIGCVYGLLVSGGGPLWCFGAGGGPAARLPAGA